MWEIWDIMCVISLLNILLSKIYSLLYDHFFGSGLSVYHFLSVLLEWDKKRVFISLVSLCKDWRVTERPCVPSMIMTL